MIQQPEHDAKCASTPELLLVALQSTSVEKRLTPMKVYLFSLGAGLLVGVVYSLLNVRSPAPPLVALIGLLGILIGEQIIPVSRQMLSGSAFGVAWHQSRSTSHLFGMLPGRHSNRPEVSSSNQSGTPS